MLLTRKSTSTEPNAARAGSSTLVASLARGIDTLNRRVMRRLAETYERAECFPQAVAIWETLFKADPKDMEARQKAKDLAAKATIHRGKYSERL